MEIAAPLTDVGGSHVSLVHGVQGALDDIYRVVVGVWVLLIVNVEEVAGRDLVACCCTCRCIVGAQSLVGEVSISLS